MTEFTKQFYPAGSQLENPVPAGVRFTLDPSDEVNAPITEWKVTKYSVFDKNGEPTGQYFYKFTKIKTVNVDQGEYPGFLRAYQDDGHINLSGSSDPNAVDPWLVYSSSGTLVQSLERTTLPSTLDLSLGLGSNDPNERYQFAVSALNGDIAITDISSNNLDLEVGGGGTAFVTTGAGTHFLWLWQNKNLVWTATAGADNVLNFEPFLGQIFTAPNALNLNLLTGIGTNPWGGSITVSNVHNISNANVNGAYIVADNAGDQISVGGSGYIVLIGGAGNDTLSAQSIGTNLVVAGSGTDQLAGTAFNIFGGKTVFGYGQGVDTISGFRVGTTADDRIDLTAVSGVHSFADLHPIQSGSDTKLDFGGGHVITLTGVTASTLKAADFLFQPIVTWVNSPNIERDPGQQASITLNLTDPVTVNTAGGSPTITLSDGSVATYDAAASNPANRTLVFDFTVPAADHAANLGVTGVNLHGAIVQDSFGHNADLSTAIGLSSGLQIGASPLAATSATVSESIAKPGDEVSFTLHFNENVTVAGSPSPGLLLSDGGVAFLSSHNATSATFSYFVPAEHISSLQITGLTAGSIADSNGYNADLSAAINVPLGLQVGPLLYTTGVTTDASSFTINGPEADVGTTVHISLMMNEAAVVNTAGGSPTLTLNTGATAHFDAANSNLSSGILTFDYLVGANDHTPDLTITSVNLNGSTIQDGHGHNADFSDATVEDTAVLINADPLTVTSVASSATGQINAGQTVHLTLNMSEAVAITDNFNHPIFLGLSDGAEATFDAAASSLTTGKLVFDYTVGATDSAANLVINEVSLPLGTAVQDANGFFANFDNSFGASLGLRVGSGQAGNGSTQFGSSGNDTFSAAGTSSTFNGAGGHDTVVFDGSSSQYTITNNGDGSVTVTDSIAGRDFIHQVVGVENLQFTDKSIFVEDADNANIARLYSAALDRAPDFGGLSGWEDVYANNISAAAKAGGVYVALAQTLQSNGLSLAGGFTQSPEFQQHYGSLDNAGFVGLLYQNVLNRAPSTSEVNAWVTNIQGGETREMVLVGFAESAENIAKTAADWLIQI